LDVLLIANQWNQSGDLFQIPNGGGTPPTIIAATTREGKRQKESLTLISPPLAEQV
jgi:hypothetical protein